MIYLTNLNPRGDDLSYNYYYFVIYHVLSLGGSFSNSTSSGKKESTQRNHTKSIPLAKVVGREDDKITIRCIACGLTSFIWLVA